jgi:hypothetical protein
MKLKWGAEGGDDEYCVSGPGRAEVKEGVCVCVCACIYEFYSPCMVSGELVSLEDAGYSSD